MKRRIFSVLLVLAMCLSMLPVSALAAEPETDAGLCPHHESHTEECGYIPGEDGAACGYVCDICGEHAPAEYPAEDSDTQSPDKALEPETEEPTEAEQPAETEEPEETDEAVAAVQALIDALPTVEDVRAMDTDGQRAAYDQTRAAYDAYMALTEDQRALVEGAELFEALFAFFDGQIMPLDDGKYSGGDGTKSSPYLISKSQDMWDLAATPGDWNKCFELTKSIDLGGDLWTPIGVNDGTKFTGTFDGGNNTISGLYIHGRQAWQGLFGYVANGSIKDLHVKGDITARSYVGGIAGQLDTTDQLDANGRIENCSFEGSVTGENEISGAEGQYIGGIVGYNHMGKVSGCKNYGAVVSPTIDVGGIVGLSDGGEVIDCYNEGKISINGSKASGAGGIVGYNRSSITNCYNEGTVTGTESAIVVGGIAGNNAGTITRCHNTATVTGTNYIGGIAGNNSGSTISQCSNTAAVTGANNIGGIAGNNTSKGTLSQCYNAGSVSGTNYIGGLAGQNDGSSTVTNGYNEGSVSGKYAGGIVGRNYDGKTKGATTGIVSLCYNRGPVSGASNIGSVVGQNGTSSSAGKVTDCYYPTGLIGGIAGSEVSGQAEVKTEAQFASGEIAWLLQHGQNGSGLIWVQQVVNTPAEVWPRLAAFSGSPRVLKVSFLVGSEAKKVDYTNHGGTVASPTDPAAGEGYSFYGWRVGGPEGEEYTGTVNSPADTVDEVTIVAARQELYAGESGVTVKTYYSDDPRDLTVELDRYMSYASGSSTEGKFTYTIDKSAISGSVLTDDGKTLTIPAKLPVGSYELTVIAEEKEPLITTFALLPSDYGTEPVTLNVTVIIEEPPLELKVAAGDITYHDTLEKSTLSGTATNSSGIVVDGTFVWADKTVMPAVADSDVTEYEVIFTPNDQVNYSSMTTKVTVHVDKAKHGFTTAPEAVDLTYNGTVQALVTKGEAVYEDERCTVVYRVGEDGEFQEGIPTRMNAGSYTVYCKVLGDANHLDSDEIKVPVTIRQIKLDIPEKTVIYDGRNEFAITLDGIDQGGSKDVVNVTLSTASGNAGEYTYDSADGDGHYQVNIPNGNYTVGDAGVFTIAKRPVELEWSGKLVFPHDSQEHSVTAVVSNKVEGDDIALEYKNGNEDGTNYAYSAAEAGRYTAKVTSLTGTSCGNYTLEGVNEQSLFRAWIILQEDSSITLGVDEEIIYGKTLRVTVTVRADSVSTDDAVLLYINGSDEAFKPVNGPTVTIGDGELVASFDIPVTAENGLSAGPNKLRADYGGNPNVEPKKTDAVTVSVTPKNIEAMITAGSDDDFNKVYDGNDHASGLALVLEDGDVVEGDGDYLSVTAEYFSYDSQNVGDNRSITANNATLTGGPLGDRSGNYSLTVRAASGSIAPKELGLEWANYSELIYDGNPKNVTATVNGLVYGETCDLKIIGGAEINAGPHTAVAEIVDPSSNYVLPADLTWIYTIGPAKLVVPGLTTPYSGKDTFEVEADGVTPAGKDTEKVTVTLTAASADAGEYAYDVKGGEGMYTAEIMNLVENRPDSSNYTVITGNTLTVTKAAWTVTEPKAKTLPYSGDDQALIEKGSVKETEGTIQYSFDMFGGFDTAVPTGLNVGKYQIWYQVPGDKNHESYGPKSVTAEIIPAKLQLAEQTFTYNGGKVFTVTLTGAKGEPITVTLTTSRPDVGEYEADGGEKNYTAALSDSNYILGDERPVTIEPKEITLIWNGSEFVYTGSRVNITATAEGLIGEDTCVVTVTAGEVNVGDYKANVVRWSNENYKLAEDAKEWAYSITPATLTVPRQSFPYDNTDTFTVELEGVIGEPISVTLKAASPNVGDYEYEAENNGYTAAVKDTQNYIVVGGGTLTITKVAPTYTEPTPLGGTYNGSAQDLIKAGSTGDGTMLYSTDGVTYSTTVPSYANAGEYTVYWRVEGDANHNDAGPEAIQVTIAKVRLTIPAQRFTYDGTDTLSVLLTDEKCGVVNGESVTVRLKAGSANAKTYTYGGETDGYSIVIESPNDLNYEIAEAETLTIDKRPVVLEWSSPLVFEYKEGVPCSVYATVSNRVGKDEVELIYKDVPPKYTISATDAGEYIAEVTDVKNPNYTVESGQNLSRAWYISKTLEPISLDPANPVYGQTLTLTVHGIPHGTSKVWFYANGQLIGEVDVDGESTEVALSVQATSGNNLSVGNYVVTAVYDGNNNYEESIAYADITVSPKPINVRIDAQPPVTKVYDGDNISAALKLVSEDVEGCDAGAVTASADSFTYQSKNVNGAGEDNPVTANNVTLGGDQSHNYVLSDEPVTVSGTITPKTVGLVWHDYEDLVYDGKAKNVYAEANQLVPGDKAVTVTVTGGNQTDAGTGYTARAESLSDSNYTLPTGVTQSYDIRQAGLSIPAMTFTYTGDAVFKAVIPGVNGETVPVTLKASSPDAGGYEYDAAADGYAAEQSNKNYTIVSGGTLTIAKAEWTVTAPQARDLSYSGSDQKLVKAGSVKEDGGELEYSLGILSMDFEDEIPTGLHVGQYMVGYQVPEDENHNAYGPEYIPVEIRPAMLTIAVQTFTYNGGSVFTLEGLAGVNGETVTATLTADSADAGEYAYQADSAVVAYAAVEDGNSYTVSLSSTDYAVGEGQTLTIEPKEVELVWSGLTGLVYTGRPAGVTATASGLVGDDACEVTVSGGDRTDAGEDYEVKAEALSNPNYKLPADRTRLYTIAPAPLTVPARSVTYNGDNVFPVELAGVNGEPVEVTLTTDSADVGEYAYGAESNGYTAAVGNKNYTIADGETLTVIKADPSYTAPTAKNSKYNGSAQELVAAGSAAGGEMQYSLSKDGPYSAEIPTGTDAGTYTVWYRVVGDKNHNDVAPQSVNVTISPDGPTDPSPEEKQYTVSFDANGGECGTYSMKTRKDGTLPSLPTAKREGLHFAGWYTAREGGTKVTLNTVFGADTTVYAHWSTAPVTGDESNAGLWTALMLVSLGLIAVLPGRYKQRKELFTTKG